MLNLRFILLLAFCSTFAMASAQKKLTYGETSKGVYTNKFFGLKLNFNEKWVVKSREELEALTDKGKELIKSKNEDLGDIIDLSEKSSAYLLYLSEFETGAPVDYNPSFLVLSENLKAAPGIKNGAAYLYHTKNLLKQTNMGFTFPENEKDQINGFDVMQAELTYLGTTVTQLYFCKVIDGYALCFVGSYKTDEQKQQILAFVNSASTN